MSLMRSLVLLVVLWASGVQASITAWSCDSDGAIAIATKTFDDYGGGQYALNIAGPQYSSPAHLNGQFTTDTPTDPTVWIVESVANQTGFAWTAYHIDIGMSGAFSIVGVVAPPDWTWAITPPAPGQPLPADPSPGTGSVGAVDYYAGTPIASGQSGSFGVVLSFQGSTQFYTAQVPVPEPGSVALLIVGLLFLRRPDNH